MFPTLLRLLCVCCLLRIQAAEICKRVGLTVVVPEVAVSGQTTAALVTLTGAATSFGPANVTIRLVSDRIEEMTQLYAKVTHEIRGQGIITLPIPERASGVALLQATLECSDEDSTSMCPLQSNTQLKIIGPLRDVLVKTDRRIYAPHDTVHLWVLALDHNMNQPEDTIARVFIRDSLGNRVALWEEIPLDEGIIRQFSLPLSDAVSAGQWEASVAIEDDFFTTFFNVTPAKGAMAVSARHLLGLGPEIAMAEEHYVELRFGPEMRRVYKPGLPFLGRVQALSTERSVRVRVKVYDNTTAIYSQDVEIAANLGYFAVPAILADSEVITLQAELVSVEGKDIDSHYVLAREPIRKWNSTSDCYLLIVGENIIYQPEDNFTVRVLSTCPCETDMHYVITTSGRITEWGQWQRGELIEDPPTQNIDGAAICRLNFSFVVSAKMAPTSQLLVYYVTKDGEPISDVFTFSVYLYHQKVVLGLEPKKYWLPGQKIQGWVRAPPNSHVCLFAGRATGESRPLIPEPVKMRHVPNTSRALDFLEVGLAMYQQQCDYRMATSPGLAEISSSEEQKAKVHRLSLNIDGPPTLDEKQIIKCFNYTQGEMPITAQVPAEPGEWAVWVLSVIPGLGARRSHAQPLTVFEPVAVHLSMPATLRVGETVQIDVRIGNNINSCLDVTALLSLSEGAHFISSGLLFITEKLRLGPHGATSLVVRVVVTTPGSKNMTVQVSGYGGATCGEMEKPEGNLTLVGAVTRTAYTLVRAEGLVRTDTESAYFCANENTVISTRDEFRFTFLSAPRNRAGVVFEVRVASGARIALSDVRYTSERMYQIVLGDRDNTVTWVGRGKHGYGVHLASVDTPNILSATEFRTFWVSWEHGAIAIGKGSKFHYDTLIKWRIDHKLALQHVGFASSWGQLAQFRIWNYNDEAGFSQVLHLEVPRLVVPGSEQGSLLVAGGLSLGTTIATNATPAPALSSSTSLAATIARISALLHANLSTSEAREKTIQRLVLQIQELYLFKKPDYSFGDHHTIGSLSDTALVLQILTHIQKYVNIDPDLVSGVKGWLLTNQNSKDGSFEEKLPLIVDIKSEIDKSEKLVQSTTQALISLIEAGLETEVDNEAVLKARYFLERYVFRVTSPEAIAMCAYTLAKARSELAEAAISQLRNISTTKEGDFGWPKSESNSILSSKDSPDWLYEHGSLRRKNRPIPTSLSEYKASLYTLMTYTWLGDLKAAEPVAAYLYYRSHLMDLHLELAYTATRCLAAFGALAVDPHRQLTVSLATAGMELTDTLELRPDSPVNVLHLPSLPTRVFVYATGAGCATVQGKVIYSTYSPRGKTPLLDLWAGVEREYSRGRESIDQLDGRLPDLDLKTCFRWKGSRHSGVLRLEITLFSGFELDSVQLLPNTDLHYGSRGERVWFVMANITNSCAMCVRYRVRSTAAVSSLRPAFAQVFPAGRADLAAEAFFHTRRGSPLLSGVADDDLVTWFGPGVPELSSNFKDVCECGKICLKYNISTSTSIPTTISETLSLFYSNDSNDYNSTLSPSPTSESYSDDSEETTDDDSWNKNNQTSSAEMTTVYANVYSTTPVPITRSPRPTASREIVIPIKKKLLKPKYPLHYKGSPRSVNKEKVHLPIGEEASELIATDHPVKGGAGKLFVVDRDTLWGMLREVVHGEFTKSEKKADPPSTPTLKT